MKTNFIPALNNRKPIAQKGRKGEHKEVDKKVKVGALVGSGIGIATSLGIMYAEAKKGKPFLKGISEKNIITLGGLSILGGLVGGITTDKQSNRKAKLREAIQQFGGNILAPIGTLALSLKLFEDKLVKLPLFKPEAKHLSKLNPLIKELPRTALIISSLILGTTIGNFFTNKLNNRIFKDKQERKVEAKDFSAHIDDICYQSSLIFKSPQILNVTSKAIPLAFMIPGYETGTRQS